MRKASRRTVVTVLSAIGVLASLIAASGCEARSSVEAAQTAVVVAQTVLPGAQATAQAAATLVSGTLGDSQAILVQLQPLLAGANLEVKTSPDGADNATVTDVRIDGVDAQQTLARVDSRARQGAASAALLVAAQYYPNASITLNVVDGKGQRLISGRKTPGSPPQLQ